MDFATLQSTLLTRLSMDTNDPAAVDAPGFINEALHLVETMNPTGWSWARRTIDITTVIGEPAIDFSDIADDDGHTTTRILDVKLLASNTYVPLTLLSREEMDDLWRGTASAIPSGWFAEGQALQLAPPPQSEYTLRCRVVVEESDLVEDADVPILPTRYHTMLITAGMMLYYQTLQDSARANQLSAQLDAAVARAIRSGGEYAGSPRVHVTTNW